MCALGDTAVAVPIRLMLPRYNKPSAGMLRNASGPTGCSTGLLQQIRAASPGFSTRLSKVPNVVVPEAKSGDGLRFMPVSGACDMPYPPRTTSLSRSRFRPNSFGLQANPNRGSKFSFSTGKMYLDLPPRPENANG